MLGLCMPAGPATKPEYCALYGETRSDFRSKEGRLELLRKANAQLKSWRELLHRFLKSNDDQARVATICSFNAGRCGRSQARSWVFVADLAAVVVCRWSSCSRLRNTVLRRATLWATTAQCLQTCSLRCGGPCCRLGAKA